MRLHALKVIAQPNTDDIRFTARIGEQVVADYCQGGVFRCDPFNDAPLVQSLVGAGNGIGFFDGDDARLELHRHRAYLDFLDWHQLPFVGAAMRLIAADRCLTEGLHGSQGWRAQLDGDTREALGVLNDAILAQLMTDLLKTDGVCAAFDALVATDASPAPRGLRAEHRRLLTLPSQGALKKQIAPALGLSETAVENRLRRLHRLFGVHNRTALLAAIRPH